MEQDIQKLKELIESSNRILITSHISPDPDAVSSVLLAGSTFKKNYPNKQISMVLEEKPTGLDFLAGYDQIIFEPVHDQLQTLKPELFLLLDANAYSRASRNYGVKIQEYIKKNGVKSVFIDHHELDGKDDSDIFINQRSPAVAQDVYEVLFGYLKLSKPEGFAQTTMTGLYADTGGFAYTNPRHSDTFKLADELIENGADIETIRNYLFQYSDDDLLVLKELLQNVRHGADYTFSSLSDDFVNEWLNASKSAAALPKATELFVNDFLRNINGRKWGFIVYKNVLQGENIYSASFRSVAGVKDVADIARKLGGGGHKPAAGAKFEAENLQAAINKVEQAIS